MHKLLIASYFILLFSCREQSDKEKIKQGTSINTDTLKSFSVIEKDSAYLINYRFNKQSFSNGMIGFNYIDGKNDFTLVCDTARKIYEGIFTKADTVMLDLEKEKIYTVNGRDFKLLKLIENKGVTDGEVSYFFSADIGLLISKSNTWRTGKILNPNKSANDYIQLTALLYNILTDEELFKNEMPEGKIKFTQPKVE